MNWNKLYGIFINGFYFHIIVTTYLRYVVWLVWKWLMFSIKLCNICFKQILFWKILGKTGSRSRDDVWMSRNNSPWRKKPREQEISGISLLSSKVIVPVLLLSLSSWTDNLTSSPKPMCLLICVLLLEDGRLNHFVSDFIGRKSQQSKCRSKARLLLLIWCQSSPSIMSRRSRKILPLKSAVMWLRLSWEGKA